MKSIPMASTLQLWPQCILVSYIQYWTILDSYSLPHLLLALYPRHDSGQPTPTLVKCLPPALGTVGVSLTPHFIWTAKL